MATNREIQCRLTADQVRDAFIYDADSGVLFWRKTCGGRRAGTRDLTISRSGTKIYRRVIINGVVHREHRVIWLYHYGEWPSAEIDHIDGDGENNRLANLRLAGRGQNSANRKQLKNNTSGYTGVRLMPSGNWQACIQINGKCRYFGTHTTPEAAARAHDNAMAEIYGEHAYRQCP